MIRRFALSAFFTIALVSAASAGSLTLTITNDAGATVGTRTVAVSTAHILRIAAVMKIRYGQVPSGPPDPITGIIPMRDRTNTEAINAFFNGFIQGMIDAVAQEEKGAAANTATTAVTPITAQ